MDEFKNRFNAAKSHRTATIEADAREAYKFCFNGREQEWDDKALATDDPEEIFADIVAGVAEDFSGDLYDTMTPESVPWVEYEAANTIDEGQAKQATEDLDEFEKIIEKSVRQSNYYDEAGQSFLDACIGTQAIVVERPSLSEPILCEAVPISQCFLRAGPRGIEDRFRRQRYEYRDLPVLFPNATFSKDLKRKIESKHQRAKATIITGYWRDYSEDPAAPQWKKKVRVDGEQIGVDEDLGKPGEDGACEMIVGRFNPQPGRAWGRGPAIRMLATLRVLDELTRMNLEGMSKNLEPAFSYPHDGMLDLSEGIEDGIGYPAMPGSAESIKSLNLSGDLDYGFFSEERIAELVREGFYREFEQRGKTPPSATQFLGEDQKRLIRMARPSKKLWREFGIGLLQRFEWLERQPGGALEQGPKLIASRDVIARPISPLERAQAREEVLTAQTVLGLARETMGEQMTGVIVDGIETFANIKNRLNDRLVTMRKPEDMQQLLGMVQNVQG